MVHSQPQRRILTTKQAVMSHSSMPPLSVDVSITATKRPAPRRRTSSCHRANDQGDDRLFVVPDARQPTGARVVSRCRARGRRNDRVSGGLLRIRCHTTFCASKDTSISLHQAHRAIGLGGDQVSPGWCVASAGVQHRAVVEGVFGDPL